MSYRLLSLCTYYEDWLTHYYLDHPEVVHWSYADQMAHLADQHFGNANYMDQHLTQLGVETAQVIWNARPLQDAWAREHSLENLSRTQLILHQLAAFQPTVVLIDGIAFDDPFFQRIRHDIPSVKAILGFLCAPCSDSGIKSLRCCDLILTCTPHFQEKFTQLGIRSRLIYHAFEPSLLPLISKTSSDPGPDLVFMGSLMSGQGYHHTRRDLVLKLLDAKIDFDVFSTVSKPETLTKTALRSGMYDLVQGLRRVGVPPSWIAKVPGLSRALSWSQRPQRDLLFSRINAHLKPPVVGLKMLAALANAKIGFNAHIDAAGEYAGNMRLFETTGVGTCLLTDAKKNMADLFEIDREVVTYRSIDEALEKINWLLAHPQERAAIAKAGQERTLRSHNYELRSKDLNRHILDLLY